MKILLLLLSLVLSANAGATYVSVETGEEVRVNDWILIDTVTPKANESNIQTTVLKYCAVTEIVNETKKQPSAYATKNKKHPLNAVGFIWFIVNDTPVQSFTNRYVFKDALTGRRNMTLPESCEIQLEESKP